MTVTIRKATAEEMLALWGCGGVDTASPMARFFYEKLTCGGGGNVSKQGTQTTIPSIPTAS